MCIFSCLQGVEEKDKLPLQVTVMVAVEIRVSVHDTYMLHTNL